jgi:hypothetical protein
MNEEFKNVSVPLLYHIEKMFEQMEKAQNLKAHQVEERAKARMSYIAWIITIGTVALQLLLHK